MRRHKEIHRFLPKSLRGCHKCGKCGCISVENVDALRGHMCAGRGRKRVWDEMRISWVGMLWVLTFKWNCLVGFPSYIVKGDCCEAVWWGYKAVLWGSKDAWWVCEAVWWGSDSIMRTIIECVVRLWVCVVWLWGCMTRLWGCLEVFKAVCWGSEAVWWGCEAVLKFWGWVVK